MPYLTALILAGFAGYAGAWYLGLLEGNFSLMLFIATVVTGLYWLAERYYFLPGRRRAAQALETADVVLLGDDLRQLPFAVRLARSAMRTVRVNVALSIGIKVVFFVLVLIGSGSMWMAVLADLGTSLLVTANGMRLLRRPKLELGAG